MMNRTADAWLVRVSVAWRAARKRDLGPSLGCGEFCGDAP